MFTRVKAAFVVIVALAMTFIVGVDPASASATKCSGPFCVTVKGTGTHVDSIQYKITVRAYDAVQVAFDWSVADNKTGKTLVERTTGYYNWNNKKNFLPRTYTSRLYTINRSFLHSSSMQISSFQLGNSSYYARWVDVGIHR